MVKSTLEAIAVGNPQALSPQQYRSLYRTFIEEYEYEQVTRMLSLFSESETRSFGFTICSYDLLHFDPALAYFTFCHPKLLIQIFEEV